MISKNSFVWYWLPVIAYAVLIFTLSPFPIHIHTHTIESFDKILHFLGYGFYAWLWYRAIRVSSFFSSPITAAIATVLICWTIGGLDELYQGQFADRDSDIYDFFADGMGSLVAASIASLRDKTTL